MLPNDITIADIIATALPPLWRQCLLSGRSIFLSWVPLVGGKITASTKCSSGSSSHRVWAGLPAFSVPYPCFQKVFLPIKASIITHNHHTWDVTSPRIWINTGKKKKKKTLNSVLKDGNHFYRDWRLKREAKSLLSLGKKENSFHPLGHANFNFPHCTLSLALNKQCKCRWKCGIMGWWPCLPWGSRENKVGTPGFWDFCVPHLLSWGHICLVTVSVSYGLLCVRLTSPCLIPS